MSESSERFLPVACVRYLIYNTRMAFSSVPTSANQSPSPSANQPTNRPTSQTTDQPTNNRKSYAILERLESQIVWAFRQHNWLQISATTSSYLHSWWVGVIFSKSTSCLVYKISQNGKYCRFMFPIAQHDKYLVLCYCTKGIFLSPDWSIKVQL